MGGLLIKMIQQCINYRNLTYDFCFKCPKNGRDLDCPEYLADLEYFKPNLARKSPSVEKPFETTDYETANGVVDASTRILPNSSEIPTHSESFYTRQTLNDREQYPSKSSMTRGVQDSHKEFAEKPFYLGHVDLMRETVLPKVNMRMFLSRFRNKDRGAI